MIIQRTKYSRVMRGQYDCKDQDYWSNYCRKQWGDCDPYWTTELNEHGELVDVLFVIEAKRYAEVKV